MHNNIRYNERTNFPNDVFYYVYKVFTWLSTEYFCVVFTQHSGIAILNR